MISAPERFRKPHFAMFRLLTSCSIPAFLLLQSCIVVSEKTTPDNVSETRSQLIAAVGGFICLYREGANPVDLLYVKDTANAAGLQVVFKIAEPEVIPEAIYKGWGDVAVGFTEAEAKKFGLRTVPLPRGEEESASAKKGVSSVLLLRSADDYLDNLLNPAKHNAGPQSPGL